MSWNVQNLFDELSSGREYAEFDPARSDWNEQLMRIRLENMREVILAAVEDGPDILLLQEVENERVLERLNREYLNGRYTYIRVWDYSDNAVRTGLLSRYVPREVHLHFPGEYGRRPLRALTELHFRENGAPFVLFNNHWKSRSGGSAATEEGRLLAAALLTRRLKQLEEEGIRTVAVAGDLNGSREDYRPGGRQTAQIPVEELHAAPWMTSLYISEDSLDTFLETEKAVLFSPWEQQTCRGSYFYRNRWMKLDHFLLGAGFFDRDGWEWEGMECLDLPLMSDRDGRPLGWESWNQAGYSDHFPLLLTLTLAGRPGG